MDLRTPGSRRVAVVGKGGSGKTMLTALLTRLLAGRSERSLLVVDADSAVNLPYALGLEPGTTVADLRQQIIEEPGARREMEDRNIREVMADALVAGEGFEMLVMGRPEGPGCYCGVNDLLRYGIEGLSQQRGLTLIDCEAGPEQVTRRVVQGVDVVLIVTDGSIRSVRVTGAILDALRRDGSRRPGRVGLVHNRWTGQDQRITEQAASLGLAVVGRIPEDEHVTRFDAEGTPLWSLPSDAPSLQAARRLLDWLEV